MKGESEGEIRENEAKNEGISGKQFDENKKKIEVKSKRVDLE